MATRVISIRLPASMTSALRASAANAHLSVSGALDWLLRNSVDTFEVLRELPDCVGIWDSKLDARIPAQTLDQIKLVSENLGLSISVFTRRLLHHFYVTRRLYYEKSNGHYTLAVRHD